jgi:hypothetical protein
MPWRRAAFQFGAGAPASLHSTRRPQVAIIQPSRRPGTGVDGRNGIWRMSGDGKTRNDARPALLRRPPTWSAEYRRGEPEKPGFNAWDERVRTRQNLAALLVVAVLGTVTYLVFDQLRASSRSYICAEAGHRNCGQPVIVGNGHR